MVMMSTLFAIVGQTLFQSYQSLSLDTVAEKMISDIKNQQMRSMQADTVIPGQFVDFSVYFEANKYVLFSGLVYDSSNITNIEVLIDPPISLSIIGLSGSTISFSRLSGDVRFFTLGQDTIVVLNSQTGETRQVHINKRGVLW